jgi:hypothetical protein
VSVVTVSEWLKINHRRFCQNNNIIRMTYHPQITSFSVGANHFGKRTALGSNVVLEEEEEEVVGVVEVMLILSFVFMLLLLQL